MPRLKETDVAFLDRMDAEMNECWERRTKQVVERTDQRFCSPTYRNCISKPDIQRLLLLASGIHYTASIPDEGSCATPRGMEQLRHAHRRYARIPANAIGIYDVCKAQEISWEAMKTLGQSLGRLGREFRQVDGRYFVPVGVYTSFATGPEKYKERQYCAMMADGCHLMTHIEGAYSIATQAVAQSIPDKGAGFYFGRNQKFVFAAPPKATTPQVYCQGDYLE